MFDQVSENDIRFLYLVLFFYISETWLRKNYPHNYVLGCSFYIMNLKCVRFITCFTKFRDATVSDCGRWLVLEPRKMCHFNLLYFADLSALPNGITGPIQLTEVVSTLEADYQVRKIIIIFFNYNILCNFCLEIFTNPCFFWGGCL